MKWKINKSYAKQTTKNFELLAKCQNLRGVCLLCTAFCIAWRICILCVCMYVCVCYTPYFTFSFIHSKTPCISAAYFNAVNCIFHFLFCICRWLLHTSKQRVNWMFNWFDREARYLNGQGRDGMFLLPGVFFVIPCIDTYRKVDLRVLSFDVPPQEVGGSFGRHLFMFIR